jgi:uncharacterized protein (TIGR03066 family)
MRKKFISFAIVLGLALFALAGCGGDDQSSNSVVGDWTADIGNGYVCQLSFGEDGSLTELISFNGELSTYEGSYSLDGESITYEVEGFESTDTISIEGDTMTLTNEYGNATQYTRGTLE